MILNGSPVCEGALLPVSWVKIIVCIDDSVTTNRKVKEMNIRLIRSQDRVDTRGPGHRMRALLRLRRQVSESLAFLAMGSEHSLAGQSSHTANAWVCHALRNEVSQA